ncbi:NUDIX hydrolase [Georgenia halophila]|uniref:NUDIX hydrolase n=1 Tax=Georgenia halophila TaxID=620889 RepID=A0ABP8KZJ8_9MICO
MRWVVSVKGVVEHEGRFLLARNERDEWELPGGQLEEDESPERCVVREIHEETGLTVGAGPLLDVWTFEVVPARSVLIVAYGCVLKSQPELVVSAEHLDLGLFSPEECDALRLPEGYRRAIDLAVSRPSG